MASKNIVAKGATYNGVESVTFPVSGGGDATFYEVSDTTAAAADVASGKYFYTSSGIKTEGTASGGATLITKSITTNGTYNASADNADGYSSVTVNVSGGGASNIVQGTFTTGSTRGGTGTFSINYTGSGYPIALMVFVDGGAYNNSTGGNTTWYNSVDRYDVGTFYMTKAEIPTTPAYTASASVTSNLGCVAVIYKNSTSEPTTYSRTSSMTAVTYNMQTATANSGANCVRFKGNGTTLSYYVGNKASNAVGFAPSTKYAYIAVYSS